jgi:cation:H+ antiporter
MLYLLLLIAGFVPLIYGAHLLVENASAVARKYNIPEIVIGLTIVAFGTSSPELVVNLVASVDHNSSIVMGNIIGSNIFNILLILGTSAIIYPLTVKRNTTWIEIPLCLLAAMAVIVMANDQIIDHTGVSSISRIDGIILLLFFLIFLVYNYNLARTESYAGDAKEVHRPMWMLVLLIIGGLVLLVTGGKMIVTGAVEVASLLGLSERVIGLTIVAAGTSLPELATSLVAARKKNSDIAIGNIVGSNIFNIFLILGLSAVVYPVELLPAANLDLSVNIIASMLLFAFIFMGKKHELGWREGVFFTLCFLSYLGYLLMF